MFGRAEKMLSIQEEFIEQSRETSQNFRIDGRPRKFYSTAEE